MSEPVAHLVQVQQLTRVYRAGAREIHALQGIDLTVGLRFRRAARRSAPARRPCSTVSAGWIRPRRARCSPRRNVAQFRKERTALRRRIGFVFSPLLCCPPSRSENVTWRCASP